MIYTISLKENKIEKTDEIFYFEIAQKEDLTRLGINRIEYSDVTKEFKYFDNTNKELPVTLDAHQETIRDNILSTFHSLFDANALTRLKQRKLYDLKSQCYFENYNDINCNFVCSLGLFLFGDQQHIDYYRDLLNSISDLITITDINGDKHEVNKDQLNQIVKESLINLEFLKKQHQQAIIDISNLTTEQAVNEYQVVITPYNFFNTDSNQKSIEDIETKVENKLMYPQQLSDGLIEISDIVSSLQDEIKELKNELKELKTK